MPRPRRPRPAPELPAPSLEGADERAILVEWIECRDLPGMERHGYRAWRDGYEVSAEWCLPARVPARLRRILNQP